MAMLALRFLNPLAATFFSMRAKVPFPRMRSWTSPTPSNETQTLSAAQPENGSWALVVMVQE